MSSQIDSVQSSNVTAPEVPAAPTLSPLEVALGDLKTAILQRDANRVREAAYVVIDLRNEAKPVKADYLNDDDVMTADAKAAFKADMNRWDRVARAYDDLMAEAERSGYDVKRSRKLTVSEAGTTRIAKTESVSFKAKFRKASA